MRRSVAIAAAALLSATSLAVFTPAATAATPDGVIAIKGPGSVYAGTDGPHVTDSAIVSKPVAVGATGVFAAEVLNTGSATAQFRVALTAESPGVVQHLLVGSTDVTSLATGPGYVTVPLGAGKAALLTLRLTAPSTAKPADAYFVKLELTTIDGSTSFGSVEAGDVIDSTTGGTSDHALTATSAGQPMIRGEDFTHGNGWIDAMTAPTMKVGATATYTMTLKNNGTDTPQMQVSLNTDTSCPSAWTDQLKVGTTDITSASSSYPGWMSPPTAPGKSYTLTLTVKALTLPSATAGCTDWFLPSVTVHATGPDQQYEEVFLIANVV